MARQRSPQLRHGRGPRHADEPGRRRRTGHVPAGRTLRAAAQRLTGEDTGRLKASIHVEQVQRGGVVGARVGSNIEYAAAHHEGHGALVPRRPGGVMVFPVRGRWVFTKHVRPVEGTEYLRKALPAARE